MILAVDTSSPLTSVAVVDGTEVIAQRQHLDARSHAEVTAPLLQEVLGAGGVEREDVQFIACGVGPGPYTGLRVGIASALAIGLAWDVPVVGLCSLDAIAERAVDSARSTGFRVAVDARRSEVYWAEYDASGERIDGPRVEGWSQVEGEFADWIGPFDTYPEASWLARRVGRLLSRGDVVSHVDLRLDVHGSDGASTANALRGASLLAPAPLYLRRPDAQERKP